MKDLLSAALLIAACMLVFGMVGRLVLAALRASRALHGFEPAVGLAVVVVLAWPLQFAGIPARALAAAQVIAVIVFAVSTATSKRFRTCMKDSCRVTDSDLVITMIATCTTLAFFWRPLHEYGLTLASLGNVDPISYALDARQALASGYVDAGGIANRDLAYSASWNWPGAVTIQSMVAGISQRPAGLSSLLALMVLAVMGQQQTAHLLVRLAPNAATTRLRVGTTSAIAALVSAIGWLNPLGGYVIGNGFIAQLGLMVLIPVAIVTACGLIPHSGVVMSRRSEVILLALLAGSGLSIYGAIAPVVGVVIALIAIGAGIGRTRALARSRPAGRELTAAATVFFACGLGGLLWFSYNGVLITSASTAGWTIDTPRVSTLAGLTPLFSPTWSQTPNALVDLVLLSGCACALLANIVAKDDAKWSRLLVGLGFAVCAVAGLVVFGASAYKAWKLLGTCVPFVIAALGATGVAAMGHLPRARLRMAAIAGMAIAVFGIAGHGIALSSREWDTSPYRYGASADLTSLQSDSTLRNLNGVNVEGTSLTSTMLMLLYTPTPRRVAISDSFYPVMEPRYRHTIAASSLVPPGTPNTVVLNASFALVDRAKRG